MAGRRKRRILPLQIRGDLLRQVEDGGVPDEVGEDEVGDPRLADAGEVSRQAGVRRRGGEEVKETGGLRPPVSLKKTYPSPGLTLSHQDSYFDFLFSSDEADNRSRIRLYRQTSSF